MSEFKRIQTNVIIAVKEGIFFKEVEFDFDSIPSQSFWMQNPGSRLFMVNNIDEKIEVKAYPTKDKAIMFNAWITKNIAYKVISQTNKSFDGGKFGDNNDDQGAGGFFPDFENNIVGTGITDKNGYPTVYGPLYHMTKIINFGDCMELNLPRGEKLKEGDKVEVLSAEIIGTHDELLNPEPVYDTEEVEIRVPDPFSIEGYRIIKTQKMKEFDPPLYQYPKLREKMCIKIKIKVVRTEHLEVKANEECYYDDYEDDYDTDYDTDKS